MSSPLRQQLILAINCTPPGTQTRLHSSFPDPRQPARSLTDLLRALAATLGRRQPRNVPTLHTAQAVHEVGTQERSILDTLNYEVATFTSGDWVRLFETSFSLSVEQLRQRLPQGTGFSLLARVPSRVLASLALRLASDFVRDRPLYAKSHWKNSLVPPVLGLGQPSAVRGSLRVEPRWLGPPLSTRILLLFLRPQFLASLQGV